MEGCQGEAGSVGWEGAGGTGTPTPPPSPLPKEQPSAVSRLCPEPSEGKMEVGFVWPGQTERFMG